MADPELDNPILQVDERHPVRRDPSLIARLAGLGVSLSAISGAIYWTVGTF
jgi:hypothetical protein